ncbi:MAG: copper chaperone Copz family protein [Nitrospirae bacterium]|nr:copper chaperone Copz family protein [Nitrospirota bacterium]
MPDRCPACGAQGRRVKPVTLRSLLTEESKKGLDSAEGYRFCRSGTCEVAYFHEGHGKRFAVRDLRVPVFQKSTDPSRLVCYCFEHTVASLHEEVRRTGASTVPAAIAEKCRRGLDRCEELNPQGACCLGNVKQVVREAAAEIKVSCTSAPQNESACCPPAQGPNPETNDG